MSVESGHQNGNGVSAGPFRHPNESAKNRLVYRTFEAALGDAAERFARGRMIDVGGGRKPWQPIFAPYVARARVRRPRREGGRARPGRRRRRDRLLDPAARRGRTDGAPDRGARAPGAARRRAHRVPPPARARRPHHRDHPALLARPRRARLLPLHAPGPALPVRDRRLRGGRAAAARRPLVDGRGRAELRPPALPAAVVGARRRRHLPVDAVAGVAVGARRPPAQVQLEPPDRRAPAAPG